MAESPEAPSSEPKASSSPKSQEAIDLSKWQQPVEFFSRIAIAVVGTAYVVGLIILNMHTRKYGIYYLGFLQIEYVMVGLLWGFLVGFTYSALVIVKNFWKAVLKELKGKKAYHYFWQIPLLLLISHGIYLLYCNVLSFLSDGQVSDAPATNLSVILVLVLNAVAIFNIGEFGVRRVLSKFKSQIGSNIFNVLYFTASLLIMFSLYSAFVYPKMASTFGGGLKKKIIFVVRSEQLETIKAIGLESSLHQRRLGPLEVIVEAPDFFLVIPPQDFAVSNTKAIRVKKDLIDAGFYLDERVDLFEAPAPSSIPPVRLTE